MLIALIQNPTDIQLNDYNEVDQILGHPSSWLLRYGISLIFVATIIFGIMAWLIKYPDIIETPVQILTQNPSIRVVSSASGRIEKLFVNNQQFVKENDPLVIVSNPIPHGAIIQLENVLYEVEKIRHPKDFLKITLPEKLTLGNMQNLYSGLIEEIKSYKYYLKQTSLWAKIWTLEDQIHLTNELNITLSKQRKTLEKEIEISYKNYLRHKELNKERVISDLDLEKVETSYLQYQRQIDNLETQIINNKIQIEKLESQIIDLRQNRKDGRATKELSIKEKAQNIKSQIDIWKQTYLITAPISGNVSLSNIWSTDQFINKSEELLAIVPTDGAGKIIAKALLPINNSGKVEVGQKVNISLSSYPYQEYGIIESEVLQIGLVPNVSQYQGKNKHYIIELLMSDSLITTYKKVIPFTQEMEGTANIITEERRIIQRIFDRIWDILKNT